MKRSTFKSCLGAVVGLALLGTVPTPAEQVKYLVRFEDSVRRMGGSGILWAEITGNPATSTILSFEAKIFGVKDQLFAGTLLVHEMWFNATNLLGFSLMVSQGVGQKVFIGPNFPPEALKLLTYPAVSIEMQQSTSGRYAVFIEADTPDWDGYAPCSFSRAAIPPPPSTVFLMSPQNLALLDNGRLDRQDAIEWEFAWHPVPEASAYHLVVHLPKAAIPVIDNPTITVTTNRYVSDGAYIIEENRFGWTWKVRALVKGAWSEWSETRTFNVEPVDTDPPRGGGGGGSGGILYRTDFDGFATGTIHRQDGWEAMYPWSPVSWGNIVESGRNKFLVVLGGTAQEPWGEEVRRPYDRASSQRFLTVEFDFALMSSNAFWFMDNYMPGGGPPDSLFFFGDGAVRSNADPAFRSFGAGLHQWRHLGIHVDQDARRILAVNFDGKWIAEEDWQGIAPPARLSHFIFRGYFPPSPDFPPYPELWIDNLIISDSPVSPMDTDGDGLPNFTDNCGGVPNPGQEDYDGDGQGDACDFDDDNDGVGDSRDNCGRVPNTDQEDYDADGQGDACDEDDDNDGIGDTVDACPWSDRSPTVMIDDCDSGVENRVLRDGCTFMDLIAQVAARATNHGEFVQGVAQLTNEWMKLGLIDGRQKAQIQRSAGGTTPVGPGQSGADERRGRRP